MTQAKKLNKSNTNTESLTDLIIDGIQDIKGKNILKLDLRNIDEAPADYFIICEGQSNTQINGIAGNVAKRVKDEMKMLPLSTEGRDIANWVCIDYFDVVLHVFNEEARNFYKLEELWNDAVFTEYQDI